MSEKGQTDSYLQELSMDARSKLSRHLSVRQNMIRELATSMDRGASQVRKIMTSYEATSQEMLHSLQHIVKKLSQTYTVSQVKYYLDSIILRTQVLSLQIRLYLTHEFLSPNGDFLRVGSHHQVLPKFQVIA